MTTIKVYLVDGRVYEYEVRDSTKAREHAHRIVTNGWRNCEEGRECYYPVWQVLKVTFDMPSLDMMAGKYLAKPSMSKILKVTFDMPSLDMMAGKYLAKPSMSKSQEKQT